jgi:hypothetical protein
MRAKPHITGLPLEPQSPAKNLSGGWPAAGLSSPSTTSRDATLLFVAQPIPPDGMTFYYCTEINDFRQWR